MYLLSQLFIPAALWGSLVLASFLWNSHVHERDHLSLVIDRGRAFFNMLETHRLWNARHGGVYVPVTDKTQPNPYINDPLRDLTSTTGAELTKINPAYMTRQVAGIARERGGVEFHITSLNLVRPENMADQWEAAALKEFEEGRVEKLELVGSEGDEVFRYMAPLRIEEPCLKCHLSQGYKPGDIRGGISISFSAVPVLEVLNYEKRNLGFLHIGVFLAGTVFIVLFQYRSRKTGEAIREREERIGLLLDSTAEAIFGLDTQGNCTFCNSSCLRMLGYERDEDLLGRNMHALIHHTRADGTPYPNEECRIYEAYRKGEGTHVGDEVLWRADGSSFPVEYWSYPVRKDGELLGSVVTFLDITERKRLEGEIRYSENFLKSIIDNEPECVKLLDSDGRIVSMNPSGLRMIEADSLEQVKGHEAQSIVAPEDRDAFIALTKKVTKGERGKLEFKVMGLRGTECWLETNAVPLSDELNNRRLLLGVTRDITERKRAEEALRASEKFLEDTFNSIQDGISVVDRDLKIIKVNSTIKEMYSYKAPILNRHCYEVYRDRKGPCEDCPTVRALASGENEEGEIPYLNEKGTEGWYSLFSFPMVNSETGKVEGVIEYLQDISARKKAEELLRTVAGEISSRAGERYFKVLAEVIAKELGADYAFIGELMNEERVRTIDVYAGGRAVENFEYDLQGTPCEDVSNKGACFLHDGVQQLYPEDSLLADMKVRSYAGIPVYSSHNSPLGIIVALGVNAFDINDRKRAMSLLQIFASRVSSELERKLAEERIRASLAEKEVLLEEIHHRVKNNMAIIHSLLELQSYQQGSEDTTGYIKASQNRIMSMALVHEKLYQNKDFSSIDLRDYVGTLVEKLLNSCNISSIDIKVDLEIDDIPLSIDELIPCGLIINELVTNSIKHAFEKVEAPMLNVGIEQVDSSKYMISVSDNGVGISDPEKIANAKSLGLKIVNTLARQLGGNLEMDAHNGTAFSILCTLRGNESE